MVRPERFELPTYSSGGCRSIQLSYGRTPIFTVYLLRGRLSNFSAAIFFQKRSAEYPIRSIKSVRL